MKRFFSLSALLLAMLFLMFNSNSFTTAEIKNETFLSIVAEKDALIAIDYGEEGTFTVTNNTEKAIKIESIQLISGSDNEISNADSESIGPGGFRTFTITVDPEQLTDTSIQLMASWSGGSAEIKSVIPESFIAQWILQLKVKELELVKMNATQKICKEKATHEKDIEKVTSEIDEETVDTEIDEEKSIPKICKEIVNPGTEVEITITEPDDEITIPETTENQLIPESIEIQPITELNDGQ